MVSGILSIDDVEKIHVNIDDIYLDTKNPRFFGEKDFSLFDEDNIFDLKNQEIIRQYIVRKYGAMEIIESVLEVGFIPVDLVVLEQVDDKFVVIEGNRRVAALKTIIGNVKRKEIELEEEKLKSISNFEALKIVNNKKNNDLKKWILQGIRHVSGVRGWGPYQQSMLINELYYSHSMTFKDIGKTIGIHYNRVSTMLRAYQALQQMKDDEKYKLKMDVSLFSYFEQAYIKKQIRDWLGWDDDKKQYTNKDNLYKFYELITNKSTSFVLMSKHIRDDLPKIIDDASTFNLLIQQKITIEEAKEKANKNGDSEDGSTIFQAIVSALNIIKCDKQLTEDNLDYLCAINKKLTEVIGIKDEHSVN